MDSLLDFFAMIAASVAGLLGGTSEPVYSGYIEAEYVYVSAASAGKIDEVSVIEGDFVNAGDLLFVLDDRHQQSALAAANAELAVAKANLENLEQGGRSAEVEVIRASLAQAQADAQLAQTTADRSRQLLSNGTISQARLDSDLAKLESANSHVAQLQAQLLVVELPARDAQQIAAAASLDAAKARLEDAETALSDRRIEAPIGGVVDAVFFDKGEITGAATPVVSILPEGPRKVLFFVPEAERTKLAIHQDLAVTCDGCPENASVEITRLAQSPQYTPPIIYSRDERNRLVYRVEGRLVNADSLLPGQPVSVVPSQ